MENTINWIAGDMLYTHTGKFTFLGLEKGKLYFGNYWMIICLPVKQVTDMILAEEWVQKKYEK